MKHILIVEDIIETRVWLQKIALDAYPEAEVELAASLREAQRKLAKKVYDLALIDIGLPDGSGIDFLRSLRTQGSPTICVVTTVVSDDATVVAALSAGADGYLLKDNPSPVLARQLSQIGGGIPPLSPPIARRIMEHFRLTGPANTSEYNLTQRETVVLKLIARGLRNCEVADELDLAESTIAGYIKGIYRKLGISSRAEAAWHATQMGLTSKN
jgi:DNA-binding NarL/FixJ family response regulator